MDEPARSGLQKEAVKSSRVARALVLVLTCCLLSSIVQAQDWVKTGTSLGMDKVRLAVADFKPATNDPGNAALLKTFNDTLWNDLEVSGVVELVSKSFYPLQVPGQPTELNYVSWNSPPPNAAMLAFGNLGVAGGKLTVQGWLFDVKNTQSPQVLGKQYAEVASDAVARVMAHKFADEIIFRLGGGIPGIAETQIYFVSDRTGHKEIWAMDYDGSNQRQLTHFSRWSPRRLQRADENRLGAYDVFPRPESAGGLPALRRDESVASMVGRWAAAGFFVIARRGFGNLRCRSLGWKSAPVND